MLFGILFESEIFNQNFCESVRMTVGFERSINPCTSHYCINRIDSFASTPYLTFLNISEPERQGAEIQTKYGNETINSR